MNFNLANMLERVRSRLPEHEVALTPGELFYCHSFELPEGAEVGDPAEFAELSLESVSPFPLETLAWGFVPDGGKRLLIYAASAERLSKQREGLDKAWYALPSFAPMLGKVVERDTIRFVSAADTVTALYLSAGSGAPHKVISRPLPGKEEGEALTEQDLLDAREKFAASVKPDGHELEAGLWRCTLAEVAGEQKACFCVMRVLPDGSEPEQRFDWPFAGEDLWNADVRGRSFAARTQNQRKRALWAWWGFAGAGIFLALLIIGQISLWGWSLWTSRLETKAEARVEDVMLLQSKNNFAEVLENVTEREMKPFAMLQAANALRPNGIYFERIGAAEWNVLRIEGQGRRGEEVTSYIDQLRGSPVVENVRNVRTETRGGRTSFDLEAVFTGLPDLAPLPPPEPVVEQQEGEQPGTDQPEEQQAGEADNESGGEPAMDSPNAEAEAEFATGQTEGAEQ